MGWGQANSYYGFSPTFSLSRGNQNGNAMGAIRFMLLVAVIGMLPWTSLAQSYGLDSRSTLGPYLNGRLPTRNPLAAGGWTAVNAFPNLTFEDPVFLVPVPGTDHLVVGGRQGVAHRFQNLSNVTTKSVFLDIRSRTQGWDDCGLLGLAFHPEFGQPTSPNRGYVYVYYNYSATPTAGPDRPEVASPNYNR